MGCSFDRAAGIGRAGGRPRRVLACVLLLAAAAGASSSPATAAEPPCARASAAPAHLSTGAAGHALQCLVNQLRRTHGLRPVRAERHLHRAARNHARDMAARDFFAHVSPGGATMQSRVRHAGYLHGAREWWLGEALVWGRNDTGRPSAILRTLLSSPPHRAILLDPGFRDLGVGVARGAPRGAGSGALTVTLDFGRTRR
ncbi:MAG TPA: CAP domain-containing protein [Baekduia sp.]|uniref:CAP domain-containing protein n=1 Tax=Baekduia sp. TaxID=2600305 RepID=UPI002BAC9DA3|nr:CAP domain-containing protein [Baekduia sp.]HMJ37419.1 CAP domain-containing protein [Baekduia sp.]